MTIDILLLEIIDPSSYPSFSWEYYHFVCVLYGILTFFFVVVLVGVGVGGFVFKNISQW